MVRHQRVYGAQTLTRVLIPVAICMLIAILNVKLSQNKNDNYKPEIIIGLFKSYQSDQSPTKAIFIFCFLIATTTLGVFCYKLKLYKLIKTYIFINTIFVLFIFFSINIKSIFFSLNLPVSTLTVGFLTFNFGCLGIISIHWKSPRRLHQFYLIIMAELTSIFLLNNLPDWTVWLVLIGMSFWDLFAVLAPIGPLRLLVRTANRRGDQEFPAILYNSMSEPVESIINTNPSEEIEITELSTISVPPDFQRTEIQQIEGTIRLGLGDFVFYSLMIANVFQTSNSVTTIACFISNLVGLTITLPIVSLAQKALPALPFPLLFAAFFYFPSHIAFSPFLNIYNNFLILI